MGTFEVRKCLKILAPFIFAAIALQGAVSFANESKCQQFYSKPFQLNFKSIQKKIRTDVLPASAMYTATSPIGYPQNLESRFKDSFRKFEFSMAGQSDVVFAINLSPKNILHLATLNTSDFESAQILDILYRDGILSYLAATPKWFRNKYFEVTIDKSNPDQIRVASKFSWQIGLPIVSQLITGFPFRVSRGLRPFVEEKDKPLDRVRNDLIYQKQSQETLATCGLSSLVQVLNGKGINVTEADLMDKMESMGIKTKEELFGINPGLDFSDFLRLATEIGKEHGFRAEAKKYSIEGFDYFRKQLESVPNGKTDVILNYLSTEIGRPGAGHYSPVGGYNVQTSEILMSETNLAMNPPFWAKAQSLYRAMRTKTGEVPRGYLVIHWD